MINYQLINENVAKQYKDCIIECFNELFKNSNIIRSKSEIEELHNNMIKYIQDGTARIVGAFDEKNLLGFIWAYQRNANNEKRYHINYFIVNSKKRNQGIGKNLIQEVYKIAKNDGIRKLELIVNTKNVNAVKFYNGQNFEVEKMIMCKKI